MDWYYKDGDAKVGPVSDEQMKQLASQGKIKPETKVWNELASKWLPYSEIVGSSSTTPPKVTQPGPSAPEKTEEPAGTPMPDLTPAQPINPVLLTKLRPHGKEKLPLYAPIAAARRHGAGRTRPLAGWCAMPALETQSIEKNLLMMRRQFHRRETTNLNSQVPGASIFASGSSICSYR